MKLKISAAWFLGLKQQLKLLRKIGKEIQTWLSASVETTQKNKRATVEKRMHNFKTTVSKQGLYPEDYSKGEQAVVQFVQGQRLKDQTSLLRAGNNVNKNSQWYRLESVQTGVLRVVGHLSKAAMRKLNTLLHVSTLILHHIHQKIRHGGRCHILCHL